jgi:DNA-binding transcriptional LysR family regulator
MHLSQLRYFLAVAEELNFSRAARRLYVSQQGISASVRRLEGEIGFALLERDPHRVELTPAGAVFYEHAVRLVREADAMVERAREPSAPGPPGVFRVGLFLHGAGELTVPILHAFHAAHPELRIEVVDLPWHHVPLIARGAVDAAFVMPPYGDDAVAITPLLDEPRVAAIPFHHPLADAGEVALADLLGQVFAPRHPSEPAVWDGHWNLAPEHNGEEPRRARDPIPDDAVGQLVYLVNHGTVLTMPQSAARLHPNPGLVYRQIVDLPASQLAVATAVGPAPLAGAFVELATRTAHRLRGLVPDATAPD